VAYEVARYMRMHGQVDSLTSTLVAILHDSMEDSTEPAQVAAWIQAELGDDVAHFVEWLTKPPKSGFAHLPEADAKAARETAYMESVQQLPAHVRLVKVIDRINNLLCVHKSPGKIEGYVQETIRHHLPLAASVDTELVEQMAFIIEALQRRLEMDDVAASDA
jgi:(p)ppGpp synthase/HD superfamily hydrolase